MAEGGASVDWMGALRSVPTLSFVSVAASNLAPIAGVLFLGWDAGLLLVLFWLESVLTGVFNALRMLLSRPGDPANWIGKLFSVPFFCVHFGGFCYGHGLIVAFVVAPDSPLKYLYEDPFTFVHQLTSLDTLGIGVLGIVLGQAISLISDFLLSGEYRTTYSSDYMRRPYGRVVLLNVCLVLFAVPVAQLGSPLYLLVPMCLFKVVADCVTLIKSQSKPVAMMLWFRCPRCLKELQVEASLIGQRGRCTKCGAHIELQGDLDSNAIQMATLVESRDKVSA